MSAPDDTVAARPSFPTRLPDRDELERACLKLTARFDVSPDPGMTLGATAGTMLSADPNAESVRLRPITLKERGAETPEADFEIVRVLGSGGMGVVHLAWQPALRREVAIKTTHPDADEGPEATALTEEAVFTGGLEHPNIVPVHALGHDADGRPVLVMKRVVGVSWAQLQQDPAHAAWQRLPADRLAFHLNVVVQVCNALHFAHSRGVVHRDLKPENVMIGEFGEVYLLDWGIAWRTDGGRDDAHGLVGTPANMAPEMLLGSGPHVTPRTDVYLLGATLHRVLTGSSRHDGASLLAALSRVAASEPATYGPSVPRELAAVCNRACARDPEDRYASARELRGAIEDFLQHRSSRQLVEQAALRVEALRDLLHPGGAAVDAPVDAARARLVFAECRFGLQQALRTWPENPEARSLLRKVTLWACGLELDQRNLAGVESLLATLDDPPPDVAARCEALRREVQDERAGLERLRSLERDMDETVARPQRVLGTLLTGVINTGVMGTFAWLEGTRRIALDYRIVYVSLVGLTLAAGALFFVFRQEMMTTRFNRALLATFPVSVGAVFVATLCAQLLGLTPQGAVLLVAMGVGVLQSTIGVISVRAFLWSGVGYLAAAVLGAALPGLAVAAVTVAVGFSHAFLGYGWTRVKPDERPRPAAGATHAAT